MIMRMQERKEIAAHCYIFSFTFWEWLRVIQILRIVWLDIRRFLTCLLSSH